MREEVTRRHHTPQQIMLILGLGLGARKSVGGIGHTPWVFSLAS